MNQESRIKKIRDIIHYSLFIIHKSRGFTLIELMVAISITAVLGIVGIAGFSNYNKNQVIQTSTNEVVSMLNQAKSRAQSQVKPSGCTSNLNGYRVKITPPSNYNLFASCRDTLETSGDGPGIYQPDKTLPAGLIFGGTTTYFFFPVQTGGTPDSANTITISGNGQSKLIVVNSLGRVKSIPAPAPLPPQMPMHAHGIITTDPINWNATVGYSFTSDVDGTITALWDNSQGGTKSLKLWSIASNPVVLLDSVEVTSVANNWEIGDLTTGGHTPIRITKNTLYAVTTRIAPWGYYIRLSSHNPGNGNITIVSGCWGGTDSIGNASCGQYPSTVFGVPDITFVPDPIIDNN